MLDKDENIPDIEFQPGDVLIPEEANPMTEEAVQNELGSTLHEMFPHGDDLFIDITLEEMKGYNEKNFDYAAGGDPNGNFLRVASMLSFYPGLKMGDPRIVALVYMMKQLDNVLWSLSRGFEGDLENLDSRLFDIHVYAKIVRVLDTRLKGGECLDYPVVGGPSRESMIEEIQRIVSEQIKAAESGPEA